MLNIDKRYSETVSLLFGKLPMFQRQGAVAYKEGLGNIEELDRLYGHPHRNYKTIHVAGTNGKGSVSHLLASILQSAGYRVGLYTSPHLLDFRERVKVDGEMISKEEVVNFVDDFYDRELDLSPSFFEISVAMAFHHFAAKEVDIAVVEVGLGGQFDSTNIINPILSVITNIGLDHTAILGNTIEKIAEAKGGIIKRGVPVVVGEYNIKTADLFSKMADENSTSITFADREYKESDILSTTPLGLSGNYQKKNLLTVYGAVEKLISESGITISDNEFIVGCRDVVRLTGLRGRWEMLQSSPKLICDTGHNVDGVEYIAEQLTDIKSCGKLHIVWGMVSDKDIESIISLLPNSATYYFTQPSIVRALDAKELHKEAVAIGLKGDLYPTVREAVDRALYSAAEDDLIFVGGSTFVVADLLTFMPKLVD